MALTVNAVGALAAGAPQLGPSWATAVGAADARLNAEVSPNGLATTARFEYIAAAEYQANLAATPPRDPFTGALISPAGPPTPIGAGSTFQAFSRQLGGLAPNTAYRYRFVAVNSAGTSRGLARAFATTELAPVFSLLDGRGWEMVSPAAKNGGQVAAPEEIFGGGVLQAAAGGGTVTFGSTASFAAASGAPGVSQYVSRRSPSGWATENVTLPLLSGSYDTSAGAGAPYRLFSTDLATALITNGKRCRVAGEGGCPVANPPLPGSGAPAGYRNYYLRDNDNGGSTALLDGGDVSGQAPADFEATLVAATPDLRRALLSSCSALTADAVEIPGVGGECDSSKTNLYLWSGGSLRLVNILPAQSQGAPGAEVAAQAGAISADGSRVYWVDRASGDLYLRDGGRTLPVDTSGNARFQAASEDGAVAFFLAEGHLYRYAVASEAATDLTPAAGVQGVLGVSADGSRAYYLSSAGLFAWRGGATTTIATGPEAAAASDYPPAIGTARLSADGARLAFLSSASLTGYDNNGLSEVFLYGPPPGGGQPTLLCASCNPTGQRPFGPSTIPGAVANGTGPRVYKPRVLSADGSRLFFDSFDALAPLDSNGERDVYEWEARGSGGCARAEGCIGPISSGRSVGGASFADASADGSDVYFLTAGSLVPGDPGSVDLYDARVGGGFPVPETPIACDGDACQPIPGEPEDPSVGTMVDGAGGNPPLQFPGQAAKSKKAKKKGKKGKAAKPRHSRGHHKAGGRRVGRRAR